MTATPASTARGWSSWRSSVAEEMRLDADPRRNLDFGAMLHDVGKVAIPKEIINKPGPLDPDEWTSSRPTRSRARGCSTRSAA